jgi:hypothetical protein
MLSFVKNCFKKNKYEKLIKYKNIDFNKNDCNIILTKNEKKFINLVKLYINKKNIESNIIKNCAINNTNIIINKSIKNICTEHNIQVKLYKKYLVELSESYDEFYDLDTIDSICKIFDNDSLKIKPNMMDAIITRNPLYIKILIQKYNLKSNCDELIYVLEYLDDFNNDIDYNKHVEIVKYLLENNVLQILTKTNNIDILFKILKSTYERCYNNNYCNTETKAFDIVINEIIKNLKNNNNYFINGTFVKEIVNLFTKLLQWYFKECEELNSYKIKYLLEYGAKLNNFKQCINTRNYDIMKLLIEYHYLPSFHDLVSAVDYYDDCPCYHEEDDYIKSYKLIAKNGALDILITTNSDDDIEKAKIIIEKLFYDLSNSKVKYIFDKIINNIKQNNKYYTKKYGFNIVVRKKFTNILRLDSCQYYYNYNSDSTNEYMVQSIILILKSGIKISNIINELDLVNFASTKKSLELILLLINNNCKYSCIDKDYFTTEQINIIDKEYRWHTRKNGLILIYNYILPSYACKDIIKFL